MWYGSAKFRATNSSAKTNKKQHVSQRWEHAKRENEQTYKRVSDDKLSNGGIVPLNSVAKRLLQVQDVSQRWENANRETTQTNIQSG